MDSNVKDLAMIVENAACTDDTVIGKAFMLMPKRGQPCYFDLVDFSEDVLTDSRFAGYLNTKPVSDDGWSHGVISEHLGINPIASLENPDFFQTLSLDFFQKFREADTFPFHVVLFRPEDDSLQAVIPLFKAFWPYKDRSCVCYLESPTPLASVIWLYRFWDEAQRYIPIQ